MNNLMIITYVFPPTGGAGVQRVLKFVKYLPEFGWQPVVVTPRAASAPLVDESYKSELGEDIPVERLLNLEPQGGGQDGGQDGASGGVKQTLVRLAKRLLFPDRHVLWLPTALPGALGAAKRYKPDALFVSGPPFSTFLLAGAVARLRKLPLILDFRDDWSGFFSKGFSAHGGGRLWRKMVLSRERALVRRAARVLVTTPEAAEYLSRTHQEPPEKFVWIPNGYDAADFAFLENESPAAPEPGRLRLLYTGTVFESHPLTPLWDGLALLSEPERERVEVEIVGRVVPGQCVDPELSGLRVRVLPYEPHKEVLRRMARADVLVLTLADLPGLGRMVPAKLFEYLAVRRPVLCLAPEGMAARTVRETGAGAALPPGDAQGVARVIRDWLANPPAGLDAPPDRFERRNLTARLARTLDQLGLG